VQVWIQVWAQTQVQVLEQVLEGARVQVQQVRCLVLEVSEPRLQLEARHPFGLECGRQA